MKTRAFVLMAILVVMSTSCALGSGDVTIVFNGGGINNRVFLGDMNTLEIFIRNSAPLYSMSLGFKFTSVIPGFSWITPYGNIPGGQPYVQEYGDAVGTFDLGGLQFSTAFLPDTILITGAASHSSFTGTYCFDKALPALYYWRQPMVEYTPAVLRSIISSFRHRESGRSTKAAVRMLRPSSGSPTPPCPIPTRPPGCSF